MKTLVFCTSYSETLSAWRDRYRLWVASISQSGIRFDSLMIIDDASPVLPPWTDAEIMVETRSGDLSLGSRPARILIHHFKDHLGRGPDSHFPGWYRSFGYAAYHAAQHGYEKLIYVESDAHVTSRRFANYINDLSGGWVSPWCPRHSFPEMSIQIMTGPAIRDVCRFTRGTYESLSGRIHEMHIPFTHVEKSFTGDRYGEYSDAVPHEADYSSQTKVGIDPAYYWWLTEQSRRSVFGTFFSMSFGEGGVANHYLGKGWSFPEPGAVWMVGDVSSMTLPPMQASSRGYVTLHGQPFAALRNRAFQRITLEINGVNCGQFTMLEKGLLNMPFAAGVLSSKRKNSIRFIHQDGMSPQEYGMGDDDRQLSVYVFNMAITAVVS